MKKKFDVDWFVISLVLVMAIAMPFLALLIN